MTTKESVFPVLFYEYILKKEMRDFFSLTAQCQRLFQLDLKRTWKTERTRNDCYQLTLMKKIFTQIVICNIF